MISVVICSVNQALAAQVKRNIDTTIGVPWELILIDNTVLKKGITAVYNMGAKKSKYDIICFVHEDVLFRTDKWGQLVAEYFSTDKQLGLVGVAGSKYKSKTPSGWSTGMVEFDCANILHIDKKGAEERIYSNPGSTDALNETITIDGVFMCARKECWERIKFNEEVLTGFHLYDIDFSFRMSFTYKVAVTYQVDMVHLTEGGDFGDNWLGHTINWHRSNANLLPRTSNGSVVNDPERAIARKWLHRLKNENISFANRILWIAETGVYKYPGMWPHIGVFLLFTIKNKS